MQFIGKNKLFSFLYLLAVLVTLIAVYMLGFREASHQMANQPERLRDVTFYIWENYAQSKHGYLVFLSLEDFNKNIAYSNHSTAYLFYMYALYKIEMLIPAFQMRLVAAFINMISLAAAVFYIISNINKKDIALVKGILILLAVIFMVSMPGFWISAARYNVDNPFPLIFSLLILISFFIWQDKGSGKRVWISILIFAIFSPISAAILGVALSLYSLRSNDFDKELYILAIVTLFLGCIFYIQAPVISKILGFTSSNSGWLFRSGLDGNTASFSNAFMAVVSPRHPRPLHIIAIPILLLITQAVFSRLVVGIQKPIFMENDKDPTSRDAGFYYFLISSQYIFICLLWPQSVSIHPYLYDYFFIAPASVIVILNFLNFPVHLNTRQIWVLVLMFLIFFNFQQIAQAKCNGCLYPSWGAN
jgi:hypothetical protein